MTLVQYRLENNTIVNTYCEAKESDMPFEVVFTSFYDITPQEVIDKLK